MDSAFAQWFCFVYFNKCSLLQFLIDRWRWDNNQPKIIYEHSRAVNILKKNSPSLSGHFPVCYQFKYMQTNNKANVVSSNWLRSWSRLHASRPDVCLHPEVVEMLNNGSSKGGELIGYLYLERELCPSHGHKLHLEKSLTGIESLIWPIIIWICRWSIS